MMEFLLERHEGGSFVRQVNNDPKAPPEHRFNLLRLSRASKTEYNLNSLVDVVKKHFAESAPKGSKQGIIYVLNGRNTWALGCLVGPLRMPTDILSEVRYTGPTGTSFTLVGKYADLRATVTSLFNGQGQVWGMTASSYLVVDEEQLTLKEFLSL